MEKFRKTYYTDPNFNITIYVNNRKDYLTTRLTIKRSDNHRGQVYRWYEHEPKVLTEIYEDIKESGVNSKATREVIEEITDKIVYKKYC
jgi:hypothetical protein